MEQWLLEKRLLRAIQRGLLYQCWAWGEPSAPKFQRRRCQSASQAEARPRWWRRLLRLNDSEELHRELPSAKPRWPVRSKAARHPSYHALESKGAWVPAFEMLSWSLTSCENHNDRRVWRGRGEEAGDAAARAGDVLEGLPKIVPAVSWWATFSLAAVAARRNRRPADLRARRSRRKRAQLCRGASASSDEHPEWQGTGAARAARSNEFRESGQASVRRGKWICQGSPDSPWLRSR